MPAPLSCSPWGPGQPPAKKAHHRTQKLKQTTSRIWQDRIPILPTPPKCCRSARNQLSNAPRGATCSLHSVFEERIPFILNSERSKTSFPPYGAKPPFGEDLWCSGGPTGLPKCTSPGTKQGHALSQDRFPRGNGAPCSYHRQ
eukprot:gene16735-biopygen14348